MKQIRNGVFETNSSSIHSIAIPKSVDRNISYASFGFDDFGWSFEEVDHLDYLHTAIYVVYADSAKEKIEKLVDVLKRNDIEFYFSKPKYDEYGFDSGYIDHGYELKSFLETLFNDEDLLIRYINGGRVFTGNDNSDYKEMAFVSRDEPTYEEIDWNTRKCTTYDNPYYMGDEYQWFYK